MYYTLDGSVPTQQDTLYQGETLELNFTTVIRARAFRQDGYMPSDTVTGTYFINAYHSLPIVSLVADPDDLWNPETGILTVGDNVWTSPTVFPSRTLCTAISKKKPTWA